MNAMIFAAGLGTRLMPLTKDKPKAMVLFKGKPLLWHAIQKVINAGATRIIVNVHHHAETIIDYLNSNNWPIEIQISDERRLLLDTGGGLVKAKDLFIKDLPIILYNADIVTDQNLVELVSYHQKSTNDATLLVKSRKGTRYLVFDNQLRLSGWKNVVTGEEIVARKVLETIDFGFCGIQVINYSLIDDLNIGEVFSIVKGYLHCAANKQIGAWQLPGHQKWFDVGSVEKLKEGELNF